MTAIGKYLKDRREYLQLTVRELARISGISDSTIYNYENVRTKYSAGMLLRFSKCLNVDYDKLKRLAGI